MSFSGVNFGYLGQTENADNASVTSLSGLDHLGTTGLTRTGAVVCDALKSPDFDKARIMVAFASKEGVNHLQRSIDAAPDEQSVQLVVGVDFGITTREALERLRESNIDTRIFLNSVTFHPKVFEFEGAADARLVVGSGNLTDGGLSGNVEAALVGEGEPSDQVFADARSHFDEIWSQSAPLSEDLLQELRESETVQSEAESPAGVTPRRHGQQSSISDEYKGTLGRQSSIPDSSAPPDGSVSETASGSQSLTDVEERLGLPPRSEMPPIPAVDEVRTKTQRNYYSQLLNDPSNQPSRIRRLVRSRGEMRRSELEAVFSGDFGYSLSGSFGASLNVLTEVTGEIQTEGSGSDQRLVWVGD
jgi:HKD family nuclease